MRVRARLWIVGVCMTALAACSSATQQSGPRTQEPRTTVLVENQSFADMAVYVLEQTRRVRLGNVTGLSSREFTIPERLIFGISTLRFQTDPIGSSQAPISQEIAVSPGDRLRLIIPPS